MNRRHLRVVAFCSLLGAAIVGDPLLAATPQERAAEIKEWRANCSDPDPDLRLAFFEAALETGNQTIMRTCVRQGLTSDDMDTRNLALRAALSMADRIPVELTLPNDVEEALAEANDDETRLRRVEYDNRYTVGPLRKIGSTLVLTRNNAELQSAQSRWVAVSPNGRTKDTSKLTGSVSEDRLFIEGDVWGLGAVTGQLQLDDSGDLIGNLQIANSLPYSARAKLL